MSRYTYEPIRYPDKKTFPIQEFRKRLMTELQLPKDIIKEIEKALANVYLDMLYHGENVPIPGIGYISVIPYSTDHHFDGLKGIKGERVTKYRTTFRKSDTAKEATKGENGTFKKDSD